MSFTSFVLGFLAFPLLVVGALLVLRVATRAPVVDVRADEALLDSLRALHQSRSGNQTLLKNFALNDPC